MQISINQLYTSIACNRVPEIVDWNSESFICYGATNVVAIYNPNEQSTDPVKLLSHHKSRVNCVKWLHKSDQTCTELLSCSDDKTAAIWTLDGEWTVTSSLIGHLGGVVCVQGVYIDDSDLIIYTCSIDSTIRIWERINGVAQHKQTINLQSGLCLTLYAHMLPAIGKPILFCALDDHKIHIYGDHSNDYQKVSVLAGHEDWVRGLDVLDDGESILLASASQDTYIRLWRLQPHLKEHSVEIKVERKVFLINDQEWSVKLEAVLAGHEGWVYGVRWHPCIFNIDTKKKLPVYKLLSSSLDKTLIIWEPESSQHGGGAWVESVRVGEVGGNGLGFYGSCFGSHGTSFLGHGYNGSLHIWTLNKDSAVWEPDVVCGGHFGAVEDVRWEPRTAAYLLSVSTDQTTRLHAPATTHGHKQWHEIARPQVHGYDMASVAIISSTTFASAAEEKVIRIFRAPHNFLKNFQNIVGDALLHDSGCVPEGATVPSLGLSNMAVYSGDDVNDQEDDGFFMPVELKGPPTEETLMQNTLWPECQKLYGHGYEVFALDAAPDGTLLASAARATTAEHAAILLWETSTWQQIQKLVSHQLTVTQLAFSPDSQRLLSVSRDRRWTMYHRVKDSNEFEVAASTDKTNGVHARIIWCCAWSHDGSVFGTGSRDGKVCLWSKSGSESQSSLGQYGLFSTPLELSKYSVTALAFAPMRKLTIATGFESGHIRIYSLESDTWSLLHEMDNSAAHHLCVKRLTFGPRLTLADKDENKEMLVASCGSDNLVRIHRLVLS